MESFVAFLEFCHGQQIECDASVEAALLPPTPQDSPTELRYRRSAVSDASSGLPMWCTASREALRSASNAVEAVAQVASLHVLAAPCKIPADCLSLTPTSAFLTLYNHALECVLQATRIAVDPCSIASSCNPAAAGCAITPAAASAAIHTLLSVVESNCIALNTLVGFHPQPPQHNGNASPTSGHSYATRTPDLLRAWVRIAFFGDYRGAQAMVEAMLDAPTGLDGAGDQRDSVTLADALCICSLALQLQGFPERALPLLSRALTASEGMKDCSQGWKCARGARAFTMALLLRAEAKRSIHALDGSYANWLDDVRTAAKCSRDESRQFAGIPINQDVELQTSYSALPDNIGGVQRQPLRVLPRLLHRLGHMYCGSVFLALSNECNSQADLLTEQRCALANNGDGVAPTAAPIVVQPSDESVVLFWYDAYALCAAPNQQCHGNRVAPASPRFRCLRHLPLCGNGSPCHFNEDQPHGADGVACYEHPVDASAPKRSVMDEVEKRCHTLLLEFIALRCRSTISSVDKKPALRQVHKGLSPHEDVSLEDAKDSDTSSAHQLGAHPRNASLSRASSFPERSSNREPLRGRTAMAFNSSYVPKQAPPSVPIKSLDNTAPFSTFKRTASARNVFDRLTIPNSARGLSRSDSVDQRRPVSARLNSSGNAPARPASAGLRRSNSAASLHTSADEQSNRESRLATNIRSKVTGMR